MPGSSAIEWTDATWNPTTGCSHVSPGCEFCYAERLSARFGRTTKPWGAQYAAESVGLHPDRLTIPMHWKQPRRIFVNSMSDLFHEQVPKEFVSDVFATMALCPQHTFQILTKRPERMLSLLTGRHAVGFRYPSSPWPLPNVWLGISAEDQQRADERIPVLLQTPAAVRFVSAEPLLGPIDLTQAVTRGTGGLDWVIVGGESGGPRYRRLVRPCPGRSITHWAPDESSAHETFRAHCWDAEERIGASPYCEICDHTGWTPDDYGIYWEGGDALAAVRSLRDQCQAASVPFFFKQWGGPAPKSAGRWLDGRTWDEYPA